MDIVVFAAGGGNDIFSALAYIKIHLSGYRKIKLIGISGLTPFHGYPNATIELPLLKIGNIERFILGKQIYCLENKLLDFFPSEDCILMSSKYSVIEQVDNLRELFLTWHLDSASTLLRIVDFGGDILTNGKQSSIISPELDAYTLAVVTHLKEYKSNLTGCFPGVDGELPAKYLAICCKRAISKELVDRNLWHGELSQIFDKLKDIRSGNTIPNILSILKKDFSGIIKLNKKWRVGSTIVSITKQIDLDFELQDYIYNMDLPTDNPFVSIFNNEDYGILNLLDHIIDIYDDQDIIYDELRSSDLFLQYIVKDSKDSWSGKEKFLNQEIMLIDIFPTVPIENINELKEAIECSKIHTIKYTDF